MNTATVPCSCSMIVGGGLLVLIGAGGKWMGWDIFRSGYREVGGFHSSLPFDMG